MLCAQFWCVLQFCELGFDLDDAGPLVMLMARHTIHCRNQTHAIFDTVAECELEQTADFNAFALMYYYNSS